MRLKDVKGERKCLCLELATSTVRYVQGKVNVAMLKADTILSSQPKCDNRLRCERLDIRKGAYLGQTQPSQPYPNQPAHFEHLPQSDRPTSLEHDIKHR